MTAVTEGERRSVRSSGCSESSSAHEGGECAGGGRPMCVVPVCWSRHMGWWSAGPVYKNVRDDLRARQTRAPKRRGPVQGSGLSALPMAGGPSRGFAVEGREALGTYPSRRFSARGSGDQAPRGRESRTHQPHWTWVRCSTRSSPVHSIPHSVAILTPFILSSCCISGVLTAAPGPGCHVLSWRTDLFIGSLVTDPPARHTLTCLGVVAIVPRPHCSGGLVMLSFEASWELRTVSSTCISY